MAAWKLPPSGERAWAGRPPLTDTTRAIKSRGCLTNYLKKCRRHNKPSLNGLGCIYSMVFYVWRLRRLVAWMKAFFTDYLMSQKCWCCNLSFPLALYTTADLFDVTVPSVFCRKQHILHRKLADGVWQRTLWQMCWFTPTPSPVWQEETIRPKAGLIWVSTSQHSKPNSFHMLTFWVKDFSGGWYTEPRPPPTPMSIMYMCRGTRCALECPRSLGWPGAQLSAVTLHTSSLWCGNVHICCNGAAAGCCQSPLNAA